MTPCPACAGTGADVPRPYGGEDDVCSLCLGDGSERRITIDGDDECSLCEFAEVNHDGVPIEEIVEIAALGIGATYTIGGGAAPAVAITRVA